MFTVVGRRAHEKRSRSQIHDYSNGIANRPTCGDTTLANDIAESGKSVSGSILPADSGILLGRTAKEDIVK